MSEQPAPRVTVTLPGGRAVAGRLHARRRDAEGQWVYAVSIEVPAEAVRPVDGEDYGQVPTERAGDRPEWVLQALPQDTPNQRALVLHRAGCWAAQGRLTRASDSEAAIFVQHGWATACDVCKPTPGREMISG
ncbi:DUF6233 domain-containing protein [Streptomyces sp. NPDC056352]|uniref:DUF6233 domain-containing protein n=1 Tax=Streptomyces sp. NPDC056352 TaxID=3345791 RepID=UPI0035D5343D